jgi:hypothetical protein
MKEGVTAGEDMLSFVPISNSALDMYLPLKKWISYWEGGSSVEFLTPEDWFKRGHNLLGGEYDQKGFWRHHVVPGTFVWAPPPAAAEVALQQMRKARIKCQDSLRIFACSRLMTPRWLKQLYKASDIILEVPAGCPFWPETMFEPLTIGIFLPFLCSKPWQI